LILLGGSVRITSTTFLMLSLFGISALGYIIGRVRINGVGLGTAGVFLVALLYGCFFYDSLSAQLMAGDATYVNGALKIVENMGLILFVSSVGFIAGPTFVDNFKKNYRSYVLLGFVIILTGGLATVLCIGLFRSRSDIQPEEFTAILSGIMTGALTSTPAFSAAKSVAASEHLEALVSVGYGIAYLFGVVGVVLFVQIIPKLVKADMDVERKRIQSDKGDTRRLPENLIHMDGFGLMPFALAAALGIAVGSFKVGVFSLTTTGGCLLMSMVFGHFGHAGRICIMPSQTTLRVFREFGLVLFLIGAGVSGGANFVKYFQPVYFLFGVFITLLPMLIGFFLARRLLRLSLLDALGSITGGMTSTPALGTLISVSGTENVASAYAATYPVALVSVVIVSQMIMLLL